MFHAPRILGRAALVSAVCGLACSSQALAWVPNGVRVSTSLAIRVRAIPDGVGGAFIAWAGDAVRIQRLTADGANAPGWPDDGVLASTLVPNTNPPLFLEPDGDGGAFVAWTTTTDVSPYTYHSVWVTQHVTADGAIASGWPPNGVSDGAGAAIANAIVADGTGGVFVSWRQSIYSCNSEGCDPPNPRTYATRVDASAAIAPGWPVLLSTEPDSRSFVFRAPGAPNVMVVWEDVRDGARDVYLTRLTPDGVPESGWILTGSPVIATGSSRVWYASGTDAAGTGLLTWMEDRAGGETGADIYAQSIEPNGSPATGWPLSGAPACPDALGDQYYPQVSSGLGGDVFVTWQDLRSPPDGFKIYAQHLDGGVPVDGWPSTGLPIAAVSGSQDAHSLCGDGVGGAIVTWVDRRDPSGQIYAQRLTAQGAPAGGWPGGGVALTTTPGAKVSTAVAPLGGGDAVVAWIEMRGAVPTVFAQKTVPTGVVAAEISLVISEFGNGRVNLRWYAPTLARTRVSIERAEGAPTWSPWMQTVVDDRDYLDALDADVSAGRRYGYRVIDLADAAPLATSETWVTIPRPSDFGITLLGPNPARRMPDLRLSWDGGLASLIVLDIAGRRVYSQNFESGNGGASVVSTSHAGVSPGVYTARLSSATRSQVSRIVALP